MSRFLLPLFLLLLAFGSRAQAQTPSWQPTSFPESGIIYGMAAGPDGALYLATENARVRKSTDGGATWRTASSGLPTLPILVITSAPSGELYVSSEGWGAFRSTNKGTSWSKLNTGISAPTAIVVAPDGTLYIAGERKVLRSSNKGSTFTDAGSNAPTDIYRAMTVGPDGTLYLTVFNGKGYRLAPGDEAWREMGLMLSPSYPQSIVARTATDLFLTSWALDAPYGLHRSTDGGTTWSSIPMDSVGLGLAATSDGSILAANRIDGVVRSTDNGETWHSVGTGLAGNLITDILQGPSGTLYAVGNGRLYRLEDSPASVSATGYEAISPQISIAENSDGITIRFDVAEAGPVGIVLYDAAGCEIGTIDQSWRHAGPHLLQWESSPLPSGLYFLRLASSGGSASAKLLIR